MGKGGIAAEELVVLGNDPLHLRLLQHDLRDEDVIGIAGLAPGQGTPVPRVPRQQPALEAAAQSRGDAYRRGHGGILTDSAQGRKLTSSLRPTTMTPCPPPWRSPSSIVPSARAPGCATAPISARPR